MTTTTEARPTFAMPETVDDALRMLRRMARRWEKRYGPVRDTIALPELDSLDVPALLDGDNPPDKAPANMSRPVTFYGPDSRLVEGATVNDIMRDLHDAIMAGGGPIVAASCFYRGGVRLLVVTEFRSGVDMGYAEDGPPILWETMIYHGGTRRSIGRASECWRYASARAAFAGHRQIVAILAAAQRARRAVRPRGPATVPRLAVNA